MSRQAKLTLAAIALFVAVTFGSFVWFVATWDPSKEDPIGAHSVTRPSKA